MREFRRSNWLVTWRLQGPCSLLGMGQDTERLENTRLDRDTKILSSEIHWARQIFLKRVRSALEEQIEPSSEHHIQGSCSHYTVLYSAIPAMGIFKHWHSATLDALTNNTSSSHAFVVGESLRPQVTLAANKELLVYQSQRIQSTQEAFKAPH